MMFYIYGIIGLEIFNTDTFDYKENSPYDSNSYIEFTNLGNAILILF